MEKEQMQMQMQVTTTTMAQRVSPRRASHLSSRLLHQQVKRLRLQHPLLMGHHASHRGFLRIVSRGQGQSRDQDLNQA